MNNNTHIRRVHSAGRDGSSLVLTLPAEICRTMRLEHRDYVRMVYQEGLNVLVISPESQYEKNPKSKTLPMPE